MKLPVSKRLLLCRDLIPDGQRVADVGTDHGYLGIELLLHGRATHVIASDLRQKPLGKARDNATLYGVTDQMEFRLCPGLAGYRAGEVDCVVCAGMGGDTIAEILRDCRWIKDPRYTLVLQPQTSGNDLRRWLGSNGFCIEREELVQDGHFLYFAMVARYGGGRPLSPGEQYLSPALLRCGSPLLPAYFDRVIAGIRRAVEGICHSRGAGDPVRLQYYEDALNEIVEMRRNYDDRS